MNNDKIPALRTMSSLREMPTLRPTPTLRALPSIKSIRELNKDYYEQKVNYHDLSKPKADSLLDLINESQRNETLKGTIFEDTANVPVLNILTGAAALTKKQFIDPFIKHGISGQGAKEVLLNTLNHATEVLDIAANLVKSQMPSAGGSFGVDTFTNALGIDGSDERKSYNFNTGHFFGDLILEVISDPLNYFTFGTAGAVKHTVKEGTKSLAKNIASEIEEKTSMLGIKLEKEVIEDIANATSKTAVHRLEANVLEPVKFNDIEPMLKKETRTSLEEMSHYITDQKVKQIEYDDLIKKSVHPATTIQQDWYRKFGAALRFKDSFDKVDRTVSKIAWAPVYYPTKGFKKVVTSDSAKRLFNYFYKDYLNKLERVKYEDLPQGITNNSIVNGSVVDIENDSILKNKAIAQTFISDNKFLLKTMDTTFDELREVVAKELKDYNKDVLKTLINSPVKRFEFMMRVLKKNNYNYKRISKLSDTGPEIHWNINTMFNYLTMQPLAVEYSNRVVQESERVIKSKVLTEALSNMKTAVDVYKYIDSHVLKLDDKMYGLNNFDSFLNDLQFKGYNYPIEDVTTILNVLDKYGINSSNAKRISTLLEAGKYRDVSNELAELISTTNRVGADIGFKDSHRKAILNNQKQIIKKNENNKYSFVYESILSKDSNIPKSFEEAIEKLKVDSEDIYSLTYIKDLFSTYNDAYMPEFERAVAQLNEEVVLEKDLKYKIKLNNYLDKFKHYNDTVIKFLKEVDSGKVDPRVITALWNNCKKFNSVYSNALLNMSSLSSRYNYLTIRIQKTLNDVLEFNNKIMNDKINDSMVNYMELANDALAMQYSYQGMFSTYMKHTFFNEDKDVANTFLDLCNKKSYARTHVLPQLYDDLEEIGATRTADNLRQVVDQIDCAYNVSTMNVFKLFPTESKLEETMHTLLFDQICNNSALDVSDIDSKFVNDMLDGIRYNINTNFKKEIMDEFLKTDVEPIIDSIIENMRTAFGVYLKRQSETYSKKLFTMYNKTTSNNLKLFVNRIFPLYFNDLGEIGFRKMSNYDTLLHYFGNISNSIDDANLKIATINYALGEGISKKELLDRAEFITEERQNLFKLSTESGTYAVKKMRDPELEKQLNLTPDKLASPHSTYAEFINDMRMEKNRMDLEDKELIEQLDINHKWIDKLKKTFIESFEQPNAKIKFNTDLEEYFNSLDTESIYLWYRYLTSNKSSVNKLEFQEKSDKIFREVTKKLNNPEVELNKRLEILEHDELAEDSVVYDEVFDLINNSNKEKVKETMRVNFEKVYSSPSELSQNKKEIEQYIKSDVKALEKIVDDLLDITDDKIIYDIKHSVIRSNELLNKFTGISHGNRIFTEEGYKYMYRERKFNLTDSILNFTPKELRLYIERNTPGFMVFNADNVVREISVEGKVAWKPMTDFLDNPIFNEKALEEVGLKIKYDEELNMFLFRKIDNEVHDGPIIYKDKYRLDPNIESAQQKINKVIDDNRKYLNIDTEDVPTACTTVEVIPEDICNKLVEKYPDFFGDEMIQKSYLNLDSKGHNNFFKNGMRLNYTFVGGYDALDNTISKVLGDEASTMRHHSTQIIKNTLSGLTSFVNRSNKVDKYISVFFNDNFSLKSDVVSQMFSKSTDEEIKEFFSKGWELVVLRKDKKGFPTVHKLLRPTTAKEIKNAAKLDAILVPSATAKSMRQVVNNRDIDNSLLSLYKRNIVPSFKTLYLAVTGFLFRNFTDSALIKNINELGGITELPKVLKYEYNASKMLRLHNEIQQKVLDETGGTTFNKNTLLKVLKGYSKQDTEIYFFVDLYLKSSDGFSDAFSKYLREYNLNNQKEDIRYVWEKWYNDTILNGEQAWNIPQQINGINNTIENTARLGLIIGYVDKGLSVNDAVSKMIKTHFDYSDLPKLMEVLEQLFWFSVFPLNNIAYYVNGGLTRSPSLMRFIMDTQVASWDNGEYSYEELKDYKYLGYHALTGNLRIGNTIVKVNPSLFDFLSFVTDPVGNAFERLNPFIDQALLLAKEGRIDTNELNPFSTHIRNAGKIIEGNPIPSIFSGIKDYNFTRYLGRGKDANKFIRWTKYPKPKRLRKARHGKYAHLYYAHPYLWVKQYNNYSVLGMNKFRQDPMYTQMTTKAIRAVKKYRI